MPFLETIAISIGGKAASSIGLSLLRDIAGMQDEQLAALKEIRQDIQKMIDGPWRKAHLLIEQAAYTEAATDRRARLEEARAALLDAYSLEPEATPRRATIAVDLALVHGLLDESRHAQRWALKAHADQSRAVETSVTPVVKALNSRVAALKFATDGDFWTLVGTSRKKDQEGTERWIREKYERGEAARISVPDDFMADAGEVVIPEEGVSQVMRALSGRWGADAAREQWRRWAWECSLRRRDGLTSEARPFLAHVAIAETTTTGGRELMRLHRMTHDVHEYRRVCLALDPGADVPEHELRVNLSNPRHARISWGRVSPAPVGQEMMWRGGDDKVVDVAFSPDGRTLVAASGSSAYVLDGRDGRELARLGHGRLMGVVWGVAFSPDGSRIATASGDHTARVWNAENGAQRLVVKHISPLGFVRSASFSPDGRRLATAAGDRTVRVWDAQSGQQLLRFSHSKPAWSVAFSPDGARLASTGEEGAALVWNCHDGSELRRFSPGGQVIGVAFSPDGRYLLTGGGDAIVWDCQDEREVLRLGRAWCVRFSPDGFLIALGFEDTVRVVTWNGDERARFVHRGFVHAVSFSPDGNRLATAWDDESVRVWRISAPD